MRTAIATWLVTAALLGSGFPGELYARVGDPPEVSAFGAGDDLRASIDDARELCLRGLRLQGEGQQDQAIADFTEAIRLDPKLVDPYRFRGYSWQLKGEHDKVIADLDEAIRLDPTYAPAYTCRGYSRQMKGDLDRATADFDEAIRLDPGYPLSYANRGSTRQMKGDHDGAIADLSEAIRLNYNVAGSYQIRGNSWQAKGDLDKALADFEEAIRLDPKNAYAYSSRGFSRQAKGEFDKAIADYDEAIRLDLKVAFVYHNRGYSWQQKGEHKKAIADLTEAIRLDPKDAQAYHTRVLSRQRMGEPDLALIDFETAARLDPTYVVRALEARRQVPEGPAPEAPKAPEKPLKIRDLAKGGTPPIIGYCQGLSKDGRHVELLGLGGPPSRLEKRVIEREEEVEEGGKIVTKTVKEERSVFVPVMEMSTRAIPFPLDQIRAYDTEGHRIPPTKLPGLLAGTRVVLFEYEGSTVDPLFLSAIREGTLFLVLPASGIAQAVPNDFLFEQK